jgi:hypothetical protein
MDIETRRVGSTILEVTVSHSNGSYTEDITNKDGMVPQSTIDQVKNLLFDIENHNRDNRVTLQLISKRTLHSDLINGGISYD